MLNISQVLLPAKEEEIAAKKECALLKMSFKDNFDPSKTSKKPGDDTSGHKPRISAVTQSFFVHSSDIRTKPGPKGQNTLQPAERHVLSARTPVDNAKRKVI